MNHHYFQENQDDLASNPSSFDFYFRNHHFKFHTDDGVFSKEYIDYGSFALLSCYEPDDLKEPVLDMGAGYGPLGITISSLYNKEVYMCEINRRACSLIEQNIKENKATKASYYQSDLYQALPEGLLFSNVITNPPIRAGKRVVYAIYEGAYTKLVVGGSLWVVIQKKQGAPSSKEFITKIFGNCDIVKRDKGYYILKAVKMN